MDSLHRFSSIPKGEINDLYSELNTELKDVGVSESLYVHGGAVMCDLGCRDSTMDIDAYYKNTELINSITRKLAKKYNKSYDIINDDIRPFLSNKGSYRLYKEFSNLKVYYANDDYLFALKCCSCRTDSNDMKDLIFLVKKLGINTIDQADRIISKYFDLREVSILYKDVLEDIWSGVAELIY